MNELSLYRFSVAATSNVCLMILEEAGKCTIAEATTHPTYIALKSCYRAYQDSIDRTKKSESSPPLLAAERRRDDALTGGRSITSGLMCSPDAGVRAKAQRVFAQFDKFGAGVEKLKNEEETTKLLSILEGLDQPEIKVLVAELAIVPFVEELRAANAEYLRLWDTREDDVEEFRNSTSSTNLTRSVQEAINGYYDYVVAMSKYSEKKAEWALLASAIHSRYLTLKQKQQQEKKDKKNDKPTPNTPPTDKK